jgi:hypothetical protein
VKNHRLTPEASFVGMNNGVKEFHLVAEPVEREMADG